MVRKKTSHWLQMRAEHFRKYRPKKDKVRTTQPDVTKKYLLGVVAVEGLGKGHDETHTPFALRQLGSRGASSGEIKFPCSIRTPLVQGGGYRLIRKGLSE